MLELADSGFSVKPVVMQMMFCVSVELATVAVAAVPLIVAEKTGCGDCNEVVGVEVVKETPNTLQLPALPAESTFMRNICWALKGPFAPQIIYPPSLVGAIALKRAVVDPKGK